MNPHFESTGSKCCYIFQFRSREVIMPWCSWGLKGCWMLHISAISLIAPSVNDRWNRCNIGFHLLSSQLIYPEFSVLCQAFPIEVRSSFQLPIRADVISASTKAAEVLPLEGFFALLNGSVKCSSDLAHIISSCEFCVFLPFFLYLAPMPWTSLVIHRSSRNILLYSVLIQTSIYAAAFISSYFCRLNVSIHSIHFQSHHIQGQFSYIFLVFTPHFLSRGTEQFWMCCGCYNVAIFASVWGKLIFESICLMGFVSPKQHIP